MGDMKKKFLTSIMVTAFILAGCGTPQTGNGYIVPQQISEPTIAEITPVYETQIERVNNCDGTNPTYNVSYKTIEAQKASFEVSVGAGGLVTGTPIPPVLEVQLEAKITAALAKDYGLTTEKNHDLTLNNVQGTFLEHTITWKVTRVKGLIEVIYGDGIAQVGFEKIANVELYDRTSTSLGCDGNGAGILPTTTIASLETQPPVIQPAIPTSFVPNPKCPSVIKREVIEQWAQIGDVATKQESQKYIDDFDRQRMGGEFVVNDVLPAGVAIVTDFGNGESNIYLTLPVRAIVHYHSFGVFEVTSDYTAIQTGACMTIVP